MPREWLEIARALRGYYPSYAAECITQDLKALRKYGPAKVVDAIRAYRDEDETGYPPSPGKLKALMGVSAKAKAREVWHRCREIAQMRQGMTGLHSAIDAKMHALWAPLYADPATRAGIEAMQRFGGFHGVESREIAEAERAFTSAFVDEQRRQRERQLALAESGPRQIGSGA